MTGHDQKCHAYGYGPGQRMDICICVGIRIGREAEGRRILAKVLEWRALEEKYLKGAASGDFYSHHAEGAMSAFTSVISLLPQADRIEKGES